MRMSEAEYADILLDEGMRYLDLYMADDAAGRDVLMGMSEYWTWWRKSADRRNRQLAMEHRITTWEPSMDRWDRAKLKELFLISHSAEILEVRPPRHVMRPAIDAMRHRVLRKPPQC